MMEIDITLDQMPEYILEDIFAFVQENADLRLVCKIFKNIIDYSAQLMKDQWLEVDKAVSVDSNTIHHQYQKLTLNKIRFQEMNWIFNYQHKDRIKAIKIGCSERNLINSAVAIQYIIMNFNSLEILYFDTNYSSREIRPCNRRIKLIPDKLSKLTTLNVDYYTDHPDNVLEMFSNIPTIKKLIIGDVDILKFPSMVEWQLEELIIPDTPKSDIDDDHFQQFLISQQSSLKKLFLPDCSSYAYFIMRNLPNLEDLTLNVEYDDDEDDKFLIRNPRLQHLSIVNTINFTGINMLEPVLNHYNNIKYLCIISNQERKNFHSKPSIDMKFENLTHLLIKGEKFFPFLNANLPNIKVLVLSSNDDKHYDCSQISSKSLKNVEKLSLNLRDVKSVLAILPKCPNLIELNVEIDEWYLFNNKSFIRSINEILAIASQVKCLGIKDLSLNEQKMTFESLLNQIENKQTIFKNYCLKSIIAKNWGQALVDDLIY